MLQLFAASRYSKNQFFGAIQQAISSSETFVLLGDFNARIVSRRAEDSEWWYVRGPQGFGSLNDAGKDLLSFLAFNGVTVCNTWFQKRDIHKQTWQHPKSNQWNCIDYIMVKQEVC